MMMNKMRPIHPGEILRDELEILHLSASAFARELGVPTNRVTSILNGKRSISADTAYRLSIFFGTTPEFWVDLQSAYDLKVLIQQHGKQIQKQVHPHREVA